MIAAAALGTGLVLLTMPITATDNETRDVVCGSVFEQADSAGPWCADALTGHEVGGCAAGALGILVCALAVSLRFRGEP
ncbi:hypothetical protein [Amycolatopsis sp. NPDC004378]